MTPQQIKARFAQANAMLKAGQLDRAEAELKSLLLPTGGAAEVQANLARVAELKGDTPAQVVALDRALRKRPDTPALIDAAIRANTRLGDSDRVLALHDSRIALDPGQIKPRADKASYLQTIGDFDKATLILRDILAKSPDEVEIYRMLGAGIRLATGDPILSRMDRMWKNRRLNDHGRMHLGFALAKAQEDIGQPDRVFDYLDAANAAQARLAPFDPQARTREWQALRQVQTNLASAPIAPSGPLAPIFVTGLPRSGTTLVEQILGAHPDVAVGGEMGHALREGLRTLGPEDKMRSLASLSEPALSRYASAYGRLIRRDTGRTSGAVTDKSMQTQLVFGLIRRALPNARFLVVLRDPRDVALSIYRNHFRLGTHRYANTWADIAETIKLFREQIAHWQDALPDQLHCLRYEDLVSDPDPQSRALIAAAGLDWDDACLTFHERGGHVKTLSLAQVRQPIHAGRRQAWRRFETEMAPFLEAWGETPWD